MKKILILLSTAFDVSNVNAIPVARGNLRINQYIQGLTKFFSFNFKKYNHDVEIIISDNTVSSKENIHPLIVQTIPENIFLDLKLDNEFGSKNKGTGNIVSFLRCNDKIEKYDFVLHFEPRLLLNDYSFFINFLNNPRNIFNLGIGSQFNTGLFSIDTSSLSTYSNSRDLNKMINNSISIEDDLYNFIINNKINFDTVPKMGVDWHDSYTNEVLKM